MKKVKENNFGFKGRKISKNYILVAIKSKKKCANMGQKNFLGIFIVKNLYLKILAVSYHFL
jgi:hypothetical protein